MESCFPGATVWKVHFVTPKFSPDGAGACYGSGMCSCSGDVTYHDPPLLFDISRDPSEARLLNPDNEALFDLVVKKIEAAIKEHRRTLTPVPQQFSVFNTIWKPWLQPCCGTFPFCGCNKEDDILSTAWWAERGHLLPTTNTLLTEVMGTTLSWLIPSMWGK